MANHQELYQICRKSQIILIIVSSNYKNHSTHDDKNYFFKTIVSINST